MKELESLSSIFKDKLFRIPDYQRGYAWTKKQLKDFWAKVKFKVLELLSYNNL